MIARPAAFPPAVRRCAVLLAAIGLSACSEGADPDALDAPIRSVPVLEGSVSDAMPRLEVNAVDGTAIDHSVPPEPKPLITLGAPTTDGDRAPANGDRKARDPDNGPDGDKRAAEDDDRAAKPDKPDDAPTKDQPAKADAADD